MSRAFSSLEAVAGGAAVFVDANIFLYHFLGRSEECTRFLERCASGDVRGATGAHILAEVLHRSMIFEARSKKVAGGGAAGGAGTAGKARREVRKVEAVEILRASPEAVRKLTDYNAAAGAIIDMGFSVFPLTAEVVKAGQWIRARSGLMVNDSLVIATMRIYGLSALATADKGFGGVEGVELYGPTDLGAAGGP